MTLQQRDALLRATVDFKHTLDHAKQRVQSPTGGELVVKDQGAVIGMPEQIRIHTRPQLFELSDLNDQGDLSYIDRRCANKLNSVASTSSQS
ncbi:hypothetical protein PTI98_002084 [Pleurotus ostreatus]|nr:hypothetical protein PTI98_002084 [Pleurotus ostreatus]